jgi:hypothetical protein
MTAKERGSAVLAVMMVVSACFTAVIIGIVAALWWSSLWAWLVG